jgi:hypothetical protein
MSKTQSNTPLHVVDGHHVRGPRTAPPTIVEYGCRCIWGFHAALIIFAATLASAQSPRVARDTVLKPASTFAGISDEHARSLALFLEASKVITSPRCMNCHPSGERPTQGDAMRPHQPLVVRGPAGFGVAAMRCSTCHQTTNSDDARVPGNPAWRLAPAFLAWQGKSLGEICRLLSDPARNGGRNAAALVKHMAEDSLVGWGWHPDKGRIPAPGTQKEFGEIVQAWLASGAACPR